MTATRVKTSKLFGAGKFDAINNVPYPTPVQFDSMQDMALTYKRDVKSLIGTRQFPDDVAAGGISLTGKITTGSFSGRMFGDLIVGAAFVAQEYRRANDELGVVKNSDNTVTVANHGGGVFLRDCGARLVSTNQTMVRVKARSDGTVPGDNLHYAVDTNGKYTFTPGQAGNQVAISYLWLKALGIADVGGTVLNLTNQPQGDIGDFLATMTFEWKQEQNVMTLNSCIADNAELNTKSADYGKPPFSFMVQADPYGNIGSMAFAQRR